MTIAQLRSIIYSHTNYFRVEAYVDNGLLVIDGYDGKGGHATLLKYGISNKKVYIGKLSQLGLAGRENELVQLA